MVYLAGNISEGWAWSSGIMPTATLHGIAGFVVITEDCISMAEFIAPLRGGGGGGLIAAGGSEPDAADIPRRQSAGEGAKTRPRR